MLLTPLIKVGLQHVREVAPNLEAGRRVMFTSRDVMGTYLEPYGRARAGRQMGGHNRYLFWSWACLSGGGQTGEQAGRRVGGWMDGWKEVDNDTEMARAVPYSYTGMRAPSITSRVVILYLLPKPVRTLQPSP